MRSTLVIVEIVASVVLLVSAGLLMRALWTIQRTNPGFRAERPSHAADAAAGRRVRHGGDAAAFYQRVLGDVRALPGVKNAAFVSHLPMGRMKGGIWPVSLDGKTVNRADNQNAFLRYVTPGYLATLGIPMKSGRDTSESDAHDRQYVAVVSESFVKRFLPNETPASAIGRHFTFALNERVIAGVAGDVRMRGLEQEAEPQVYLPFEQVDDGNIIGYIPRWLIVRTSTPPETLAAPIRAVIRQADPTLPVNDVNTMTRRGRSRHGVAGGAGAGARGVCRDRVRAGRDRHPRTAVVLGFAAGAGDRRADGAGRAVGRHPAHDCCAAA